MRVGIICLYYKNHNYGGLLQAYALTNYLNSHGVDCEQISWDFMDGLKRDRNETTSYKSIGRIVKTFIISLIEHVNKKNQSKRMIAFERFEKIIPHSSKVYTRDNIEESITEYDCFITGSDQVWNMSRYNPEQFLCFVPTSRVKLSYAASMPDLKLTKEQKKIVCDHLKTFDAVSVREKITAEKLNEWSEKKVEWVLDPTLLLTALEWEKVARPYEIKDDYIFCYFLGGRKDIRHIAEEFAKKIGFKIATFSHLGCTNVSDVMFGDYKIYDAAPDEFLSLIKNAKYVLTDSFHATVFSYIFKKKFFVFSRAGQENTDSRITSLLEVFDEPERFCNGSRFNAAYLLSLKDKAVTEEGEKFVQMKEKSEQFLIDGIQTKK